MPTRAGGSVLFFGSQRFAFAAKMTMFIGAPGSGICRRQSFHSCNRRQANDWCGLWATMSVLSYGITRGGSVRRGGKRFCEQTLAGRSCCGARFWMRTRAGCRWPVLRGETCRCARRSRAGHWNCRWRRRDISRRKLTWWTRPGGNTGRPGRTWGYRCTRIFIGPATRFIAHSRGSLGSHGTWTGRPDRRSNRP